MSGNIHIGIFLKLAKYSVTESISYLQAKWLLHKIYVLLVSLNWSFVIQH